MPKEGAYALKKFVDKYTKLNNCSPFIKGQESKIISS